MEKSQIHHLLEKIRVMLDLNNPTSQIEKDVIMDYLRRVYDSVSQLPVRELKTDDIAEPEPTQEPQAGSNSKLTRETSFVTFEPTQPHYHKPTPVKVDFQKNKTSFSAFEKPAFEKVLEKPNEVLTIQDLFNLGSVNELSEKISAFPVNDLNQAFSINDRLLIINELFGGDSHYFSNTIESINRCSTFEEVKTLLVRNVIYEFGWVEPGKQQTVKAFLKLVRRRFQD